MAGLFAVVHWETEVPPHHPSTAERSAADLEHVLLSRPAAAWERVARAQFAGGAFAIISPEERSPRPPSGTGPATGADETVDLGSAALLRDEGTLAIAVAGGRALPATRSLLAALRSEKIPGPSGPLIFCPHAAIAFDGSRLLLVLDQLGAWPLYMRLLPRGVAIGSAALPLAKLPPAVDIDPIGVSEMLTFGQLMAEHTLYRGVEALPPGARFVLTAGQVERTRTEAPSTPAARRTLAMAADLVHATLAETTSSILAPDHRPALLLSGGLDSRLILALLATQGAHPRAYTFGQPGCADERLARRAAAVVGVDHQVRPWTPDGLARVLEPCAALTDGHISALHFHGADILWEMRQGASHQWNGFAGDAILGGSFAHPRYSLPGPPLPERLFTVFNQILRPGELSAVIQPRMASDLADQPRAALARALAVVPPGPAPDRARQFLLATRVGRLAAAGLAIDRHFMPVITPYAEVPALGVMAELRLAERRFGRALAQALVRHHPELARIPWQRTGAPPGTPWPIAAAVRSAGRLASRFGFQGMLPLADYPAWLDGPLAPLRQNLIMSPALIDHDLFAADRLAELATAPVRSPRDAALAGILMAIAVAVELLAGKRVPSGEWAPPEGE
jgi:asparagine synthase (glutamine-hydrolysing)